MRARLAPPLVFIARFIDFLLMRRLPVCQTDTSLRQLCHGFPAQMEEYLRYCRVLEFEARPDYNYLRGLFREVLVKLGATADSEYDWIKRKRQEREMRAAKTQPQSGGGGNGSSSNHRKR